MAFSICSFSSIVPLCSTRPNRLWCRAQDGDAAPSSKATQTSSKFSSYERRSANYPPSVWEDGHIQSLKIDFMEENIASEIRKLKEETRRLLGKEKDVVCQLRLVDSLEQLGVAYHFEKEIEGILTAISGSIDEICLVQGHNLSAVSLLFRLLREHGFNASQEVFNIFTDENGRFKAYLCNDINGILSLYEASFLAMEGEDKLDAAKNLATTCLQDVLVAGFLEPSLKEKVSHALELPLHWRMQRLHIRWFIDQYETEEGMNPLLLKLAKLDFNMLQGIYKSELKQLSRWWIELGIRENLGFFARDRLVENYYWAVGWAYEPEFSRSREAITKANCMITTIDDVYDVYGTLDELELFTHAVERWDASVVEDLPDYMKICFMALFNTTNDTAYKILKLNRVNVLPFLKRSWTDLCKAYLVEAKWYHGEYKPTMKEYLDNAWISISGHVALTHAYCTSENITMQGLDRYGFYPDAVRHSSMIFRLSDDLATSTEELMRGDVSKSIQCYMHESRVSEATAREYINEMIAYTWKKLNGERVVNSTFEKSYKKVAMNLARMAQCIYQNGDGYGEPAGETKEHVTTLLIQPITF